jgi:hypothetical protein
MYARIILLIHLRSYFAHEIMMLSAHRELQGYPTKCINPLIEI